MEDKNKLEKCCDEIIAVLKKYDACLSADTRFDDDERVDIVIRDTNDYCNSYNTYSDILPDEV